METIRTFKILYFCPDSEWNSYYSDLSRTQSNAIRIAYNRFKESKKEVDIRAILKSIRETESIEIDKKIRVRRSV